MSFKYFKTVVFKLKYESESPKVLVKTEPSLPLTPVFSSVGLVGACGCISNSFPSDDDDYGLRTLR